METRQPPSPSPLPAPRAQEAEASPSPNTLRAPAPGLFAPVPSELPPLQQNRLITQGYLRIAHALQALIDPTFEATGSSSRMPCWFAFAPHASQEAGKGILGAEIADRIIDAAQGEPATSLEQALARAGHVSARRITVAALSHALSWYGLPRDVAAALASLHGALNLEALIDPRTLATTAERFAKLYMEAPGADPLSKAEAVATTLRRTLNEGNVLIFADIGGAADAYLSWRAKTGDVPAARVLAEFSLPTSRPDEAQQAYTFALQHAQQVPRPSDFARLLPGLSSASLVVAAFALYEQSRQASSPAVRDGLIGMANNYVAYREQFHAVQPAFSPPVRRPDEVPRLELMQALTPVLCLEMGSVEWRFTDYASTQRDRDGRLITSKATEYNWALFSERWPAILQSFEFGYRDPKVLWVAPPPLIRPDGQLTGAD